MLISIALALLASADGLSLKLKKRKIRNKRDFSAIDRRWKRDGNMENMMVDMLPVDDGGADLDILDDLVDLSSQTTTAASPIATTPNVPEQTTADVPEFTTAVEPGKTANVPGTTAPP